MSSLNIGNFIWNIADDVLRDVYVRGKYRDVILPMSCQPGKLQIRAIRSGRGPLDDGQVRDIDLRPGLFRISKNSRAVTPT